MTRTEVYNEQKRKHQLLLQKKAEILKAFEKKEKKK